MWAQSVQQAAVLFLLYSLHCYNFFFFLSGGGGVMSNVTIYLMSYENTMNFTMYLMCRLYLKKFSSSIFLINPT